MNAKIKNAMTVTITPVRDIYAHLVRFFLPHLVALWVRYLYCLIDCFRLPDLFGSWILEQRATRSWSWMGTNSLVTMSRRYQTPPTFRASSTALPMYSMLPRLGCEQLFSAGHVFSLGQYARADNSANTQVFQSTPTDQLRER